MTKYEQFYRSKVSLKGLGTQRTASCPFCGHKNDLSINIETGQCKCFQCEFEGDTFDFLQRLEGIEFKEARKELMKYRIEPITEKQDLGVLKERKSLSAIIEGQMFQYAEKCANNVPDHVISYLKKARRLSNETVNRYQIGFCLKHPNYRKDGYERLTIPIRKNGKIINIRFHAVGEVREGDPKTLPYCSGLPEAISLFPEDQLENDAVYLVEGELDALCAISHGLPGITITGGAGSWREEFTPFFKDKKVNIAYDCDEGGRKGAERIAGILCKIAEVKIIDLSLGNGEDLTDWFMKHGKSNEELERLARNTSPYQKKPPETKQKAKAETRTLIPGLVHLIRQDGAVKYLLKKEGSLSIEEAFILNNVTYKPKQDLPIEIPDEDILKEPTEIDYSKLLEEVAEFTKAYLEMPSDSHYSILALWIFHTYLIEKFNTTPILYFYGVKETGKTRAGEVLGKLVFRCERLTSPTEATLFRSASYFKTSLIIDEIKLWGEQGNQEVARLIKSRYKRGLMVSRVNLNKKGEDQLEYFDVFAPLVICTTESIPDTIESRCITFLMQKNARVEVEKLIDEDWAGRLRNKLTILRANYLDQDLPEAEQIARRRLNEIMLPLFQVLMLIAPERKEEFKMIVEEMERAKEEEEGLSLEAEIVEKIINYQKETGEEVFLTTEIAERLNRERSEREKISNTLASIRIRRLGFEKTRLGGKRGFRIHSELLTKLALQFGLDL